MKGTIILGLLCTAVFAAAKDKPDIRICVATLANHSKYDLPLDKLTEELASELSHKQIKATAIPGQDLQAEMEKNGCEYLLSGLFSDSTLRGSTCPKCPSVDEQKYFALHFRFYFGKGSSKDSEFSGESTTIDKKPRDCADDHVWQTAQLIRKHFNNPR